MSKVTELPFTVETTESPEDVISRLSAAVPGVTFQYVETEHLPALFQVPPGHGILHLNAKAEMSEKLLTDKLRKALEAGALNREGENEYVESGLDQGEK